MKKLLYASYGVLGHEYRPVFTLQGPTTDHYDVYEIELPEGWSWAENSAGELLIEAPDGVLYLPHEIITNRGDTPVLSWVDDRLERHWKKIPARRADKKYWYAVMADDEDLDWGTGSYNLAEAEEMVKDYPNGYIAVIDEGNDDPVCVEEIRSKPRAIPDDSDFESRESD